MPKFYLSLPFLFLKFWYLEAPVSLIKFFSSLNHAYLQIVSFPIMVRTFFKPLKNEYRKGLVGFSIGMGIFLKSVFILIDLFFFLVLVFLEILFVMFFLWWPLLSVFILFI